VIDWQIALLLGAMLVGIVIAWRGCRYDDRQWDALWANFDAECLRRREQAEHIRGLWRNLRSDGTPALRPPPAEQGPWPKQWGPKP
jgi:hypothetical protein